MKLFLASIIVRRRNNFNLNFAIDNPNIEDELKELFPLTITHEHNDSLTIISSTLEIKATLYKMHDLKAIEHMVF